MSTVYNESVLGFVQPSNGQLIGRGQPGQFAGSSMGQVTLQQFTQQLGPASVEHMGQPGQQPSQYAQLGQRPGQQNYQISQQYGQQLPQSGEQLGQPGEQLGQPLGQPVQQHTHFAQQIGQPEQQHGQQGQHLGQSGQPLGPSGQQHPQYPQQLGQPIGQSVPAQDSFGGVAPAMQQPVLQHAPPLQMCAPKTLLCVQFLKEPM